jgi:hypothetical protein
MSEAEETRSHFYRDVVRLGNVAVSRHAQASMIEDGISQEAFDKALLTPTRLDVPDGQDILWRVVVKVSPRSSHQAKNCWHARAYARRVFALRILAVKNSRSRHAAASPASAISAGTR